MNQDVVSHFGDVVTAFEKRYGSVDRGDFFGLVTSYYSAFGRDCAIWSGGSRTDASSVDFLRFDGVGTDGKGASVGSEVGRAEVGSTVCSGASWSSDIRRHCDAGVVSEPVGSGGSGVSSVMTKGKHWKKNLAKRLNRKKNKVKGSQPIVESLTDSKKVELASSYDDRRIAENKLATQKAEYQLKKNEYMTRSRVAEQQWETERLTCDQKLQKISEARFGSKPGFAETLVSANISSSSLPSLSQGTLSPDSSISVAEVNRMFKLIADLTAQVAQLTVESKAMKETAVLSAYEQRKLEMENMTFEQIAALRGTEKDIRPDGSPVKYDAVGQEIYSECGRPDFMNQYDYRSSITVSEDGQ